MPSSAPIYLDSHATTPVDPRVLEAMLPWLTEKFGNAASNTHSYGWEAAEAVEYARDQIAAALNADPKEIIFTSGATESNNLAIKGIAEANQARGNHLVTCVTEHRAVLDPMARLEKQGFAVTRLGAGRGGLIDLDELRTAIRPETILVSIMHANNEIGVIQDIAAIGAVCAERGVPFHTDASQSAGKIPIDMATMGISLLSLSGHKLYAPKGIGVLAVRKRRPRVRLAAQLDGGGHERGLRSGTLNVPAIVALGRAMEIAAAEMTDEAARLGALRDRLRTRLFEALDGIEENGDPTHKLPHSLNVAIRYVESGALLNAVPEIAASTGSACSSAEPEPSHVLLALGEGEDHARSSVRFGLTRFTTAEEIDRAAGLIVSAVHRLRGESPMVTHGGIHANG